MTRSGFLLPFRLFGIPVRLDVTFLILLGLLTWLIGGRVALYVDLFDLPLDPARLARGVTPWALGLAAALGLMVSVLAHELAHALVARRFGVTIREIRLWLLGGLAQFDAMPEHPRQELLVALAGPLMSVTLGGLFWLLAAWLGATAGAMLVVLSYLAVVNVVLAVFNMLPALPMDGGRVLRALLALRLPHVRATRIAASVSRVTAVLMGLYGLATFNVLLMAIAIFVYLAGQAESQNAVMQDVLGHVALEDVMTRNVDTVGAGMPVPTLLDAMIDRRHVFFPVVGVDGTVVGTVNLRSLQGAAEEATVADVMTRDVVRISMRNSAADAFEAVLRAPHQRLIVEDEAGRMVGLVSTSDLLRVVQVHLTAQDRNAGT